MSERAWIADVLQVGDEVIITILQENREAGYNPCADGTKGTIVGFSEIYYPRIQNYGLKPGVYLNKKWVNVKIEGQKKPLNIYHANLTMVDQQEYERRVKEWCNRGGSSNWHEESVFVRDLPETKFWEGDKVRQVTMRGRSVQVIFPGVQFKEDGGVIGTDNEILVIVGIEYDWKEKGEPWTYRISSDFGAGWYTHVREDELVLVERGNVWKYYHNKPLQFEDLREEVNFFKMLGHYEEVPNPNDGIYYWTKDEVLEAIQQGIVDGFVIEMNPLTGKTSISAIKMRDESLGRRLRQATLKGFGLVA